MTLAVVLLISAFQVAQISARGSAQTPPPTIIRLKTTPFCQVFRDNVFKAVQGLRVNDLVIDQGRSILSKWAYDSATESNTAYGEVAETSSIRGPRVKMDQYQMGQIVSQTAHNLTRVYALLNDPDRFPKNPQTSADRDLIAMKETLQAVADAQERSLNIFSGTYETAALYSLLSLGDQTASALRPAGVGDKDLDLGKPILPAPGISPLPVAASQAHGSLFANTSVGRISTAVGINQRLTDNAEDHVTDAVMPGVDRCRGTQ
jgi:hypothetical protein